MYSSLTNAKYLTSLALKSFCERLPSPTYTVRIVYPDNYAETRVLKQPQLLDSGMIGFLRARNMQANAAIYIYPDIGRYVLVDLDKDGYQKLRNMAADHVPIRIALETSPDHVQVWLKLDTQHVKNTEYCQDIARYYAHTYGGDVRAANSRQFGRAPGFFNRKPVYKRANGHYPLVRQLPIKRSFLKSGEPIGLEGRDTPKQRIDQLGNSQKPLTRCAARGAPLGAHAQTADIPADIDAWLDNVDSTRPYAGPLSILSNGKPVAVLKALPELGCHRSAYQNAFNLLLQEGFQTIRKPNGEQDRSWLDLKIAETILLSGYSVEFAVAAVLSGSEKASERDQAAGWRYAWQQVVSAAVFLAE